MSDKYPVTKYSVTLAPLTRDDHALLTQWTSSSSWVYASGTHGRMSSAELKAFIDHIDQSDEEFVLVYAPDGQAIGMVSSKPTGTPGNYVVGIIIGDADMWGIGFGFEATALAVGMLFDSKRAHRVEFITGAFNRRAISDICSGGLITVEGILRDYFFIDGEYHDALIGSILRDEYYALRGPSEVIPAKEKDEARRIIADFIEKNPIAPRSKMAAPTAVNGNHA
jgi:diamine N-acetyltransferase